MPDTQYPSPDGRMMLSISSIPMLMSHEIDCPLLIDSQTEDVIFDPGEMWEASEIEWSEDSKTLRMGMNLYPHGDIDFDLLLDLENKRATLSYEGKPAVEGTLTAVQKKMQTVVNARTLAKRAV